MPHAPFSVLCSLVLCAFALQPMRPATAATRTVQNCNDHGAGSLRAVVAGAASGDRIDLASLACGRIELTSGQIEIPQDDLKLFGRNPWSLTIDGNHAGRVFAHTGTGTLRVRRLSVANGSHEVPHDEFARGGCIYSAGTVELRGSRVHHCVAYTDGFLNSDAQGGGVFAEQLVDLFYSDVFANTVGIYGSGAGVASRGVTLYRSHVYGNSTEGGQGGGVLASHAQVVFSLVDDNQATYGAGVYSYGEVTVRNSTISGNRAVPRDFLGGYFSIGGGLYANGAESTNTVVNSTISGNLAYGSSAAFFGGDTAIFNSTITANEENPDVDYGPNLCEDGGAVKGNLELHLASTIVAGNTCSAQGQSYDIGAGTVVGSHNLVGTSAVSVPADTIFATDPRLAPLAGNGGPTPTHALLGDSLAIDHGSNPLLFKYDQRGPGFPRVKGGQPDIGAVER